MTVRIRLTKTLKLDAKRIAKVLPALILGAILRRVAKGRDTSDRPFAKYSSAYLERLTEMNEGHATDLRLTGGLLNSLRHLRTSSDRDSVTITVGPGTGTSPQVQPPSRRTSASRRRRSQRTRRRGPPHNVLGGWLHKGTPHMPARPWLGLSKGDLASIMRQLRETIAAVLR